MSPSFCTSDERRNKTGDIPEVVFAGTIQSSVILTCFSSFGVTIDNSKSPKTCLKDNGFNATSNFEPTIREKSCGSSSTESGRLRQQAPQEVQEKLNVDSFSSSSLRPDVTEAASAGRKEGKDFDLRDCEANDLSSFNNALTSGAKSSALRKCNDRDI